MSVFTNLSIRTRILMIFTTIVVTGGVLQLLIAGTQIQAATLEYFRHDLETHALVAAAALSEPLHEYRDGESDFLPPLVALQVEMEHGYVILDHERRVLGFSAGQVYQLGETLPLTQELIQLRRESIGWSIRDDHFQVVAPVQYEGKRVGYVLVSEAVDPAYAQVIQRWVQLVLTTLPVIGLVIAASLWIARTISRPVQNLRNTALRMAEGALEARFPVHSRDEVGQLGGAFNYMASQLHQLMKAQRSFVSNAAHELRTPLMTLKLRIEALQDASLPETSRQAYLREIHQEIDHMAHLVTSLLVLARLDEGRHTVNRSNSVYDLEATLHDIARHWRIEASRIGLRFETRIPSDLSPLKIEMGDLRLVLDNVIGNAMKYTPEGCVTLTVESRPNQFIMEVRDTGIGFPPEQGATLFERFYRTESARSHSSGSGLGLAIVSGILQQYGATIRAHSEGLNKGATFEISFPVALNLKATALS